MSGRIFLTKIQTIGKRIEETQFDNIQRAAQCFSRSIAADRMVHLFGAGHSAIPVMEAFPRTGSIVGFHPIIELPTSFNVGVVGQMGIKQAAFLEGTSGYANAILDNYQLDTRDCLVVFSNSGINTLPVELAVEGRRRGLKVIAVVSVAHSNAQTQRHAAGRLTDHADIVIDNCVPEGDALIGISGLSEKVAAGSTIAACMIMNALVAETARLLVSNGFEPTVCPSHNIDDHPAPESELLSREDRVLEAYREMKRKV